MTKICPVCQSECEDTAEICLNEMCGWQFIQLLSDSQTEKSAFDAMLLDSKSTYLDKMIKLNNATTENHVKSKTAKKKQDSKIKPKEKIESGNYSKSNQE